ncbi:MAG: ATP-dependent DNA ligase [Oleiphilaceae bacterium]|jgi:ATP-dependent DNA ligase
MVSPFFDGKDVLKLQYDEKKKVLVSISHSFNYNYKKRSLPWSRKTAKELLEVIRHLKIEIINDEVKTRIYTNLNLM